MACGCSSRHRPPGFWRGNHRRREVGDARHRQGTRFRDVGVSGARMRFREPSRPFLQHRPDRDMVGRHDRKCWTIGDVASRIGSDRARRVRHVHGALRGPHAGCRRRCLWDDQRIDGGVVPVAIRAARLSVVAPAVGHDQPPGDSGRRAIDRSVLRPHVRRCPGRHGGSPSAVRPAPVSCATEDRAQCCGHQSAG